MKSAIQLMGYNITSTSIHPNTIMQRAQNPTVWNFAKFIMNVKISGCKMITLDRGELMTPSLSLGVPITSAQYLCAVASQESFHTY